MKSKTYICNQCDDVFTVYSTFDLPFRTELIQDGLNRKNRVYLSAISGDVIVCRNCKSTNIYPEDIKEVVLK